MVEEVVRYRKAELERMTAFRDGSVKLETVEDLAQFELAAGSETVTDLRVRIFLRTQVLRLSIPPQVDFSARVAFRGHPTQRTPWGRPWKRLCADLIPQLKPCGDFVSAGELLVKAKVFDDGLCAAVEMASQEPCGSFRGKRPLLRALLERMQAGGDAASIVAAACQPVEPRVTRSYRVVEWLRRSLTNDLRSRPIGFYTWNDDLGRTFRQDRLLQSDLSDANDAGQLAEMLAASPDLRTGYEQCLRLAEQSTNPLACADFRPWIEAIDRGVAPPPIDKTYPFPPWLALFPPSRAHETDLVKRLFGDRPVSMGFDLLEELTRAIRGGAIELAPRPDSGWHDWQTWALETLAAPERAEEAPRLDLTPSYRQHLDQLLRVGLSLAREVQVKSLDVPTYSCCVPPILVRPKLRLEPLVTYYTRRAEGYRFIGEVLAEAFGEAALSGLHRLRPDGRAEATLAAELAFMAALFDGAANVARLELGMSPTGDTGTFREWMATRGRDADLTADLRMMVPVGYDVKSRRARAWMFLGWLDDWLDVGFAHPPEVQDQGGRPVKAEFKSAGHPIARPVVVECNVSRLLERDEFRRLCDRRHTPAAVVRAVR